MSLYLDPFEELKIRDSLAREWLDNLSFEEMIENLRQYASVEDEEEALAAVKSGMFSELGAVIEDVIKRAAKDETKAEVERIAEEREQYAMREEEKRLRNLIGRPDGHGVWLANRSYKL